MASTYTVRRAPAASPSQVRNWLAALFNEQTLVLALIAVGLLAHGVNMFHYPSFTIKDDEGIYTEQAWAVLREGHITHYTYTYDHAPGGWLQYAVWMALTGGVNTFGNAVDSGRVLMLLLHLAMIPLLYRLTRKLGGTVWAAGLATLLFSLSPLAVFYQRMVLLDNFMTFWLLLSMNLLLDGRGRLSRLFLSGLCFGMALLSKETAVFLVPVLLLIAWHQRWEHQGRFAVWAWLVPMLMVISWYPLFASFKGELFPNSALTIDLSNSASADGNRITGVSLLQALVWQATRPDDGRLWKELIYGDWIPRDAFLFIGGAVASFLNLLLSWRNRRYLIVSLMGILPLYYLGRGGVVFSYYIVFAIPFLALNLAFLADFLLSRLPRLLAATFTVLVIAGLVGGYLMAGTIQPLFTQRPDEAGREAVAWIKQNLPPTSKIIMRDDMWTDMHESNASGPGFPDAHTHWKVKYDPAVYDKVFKNDWRQVDYLVISPGLNYAFEATSNQLALDALSHAVLVKRWASEKGDTALHEHQIVELWKVNKEEGTSEADLLAGSAAYLTSTFEQNGAYLDADGTATAQSQAYALLRAAWAGNRDEFYRVWNWTRTHLMNQQKLLYWQWRSGTVVDIHTAADADTDTALALLMASKRWDDWDLIHQGRDIVQAIWQQEVTLVQNRPYLVAGDWAADAAIIPINPGYFAPYAYRVFQEVDPNHDWQGVLDSGYGLLLKASAAQLGLPAQAAKLPPDWIGLNRKTGELVPLKLDNEDTTNYSSEGARAYWRVALDLSWNDEARARLFLKQTGFLRDELVRKGYVSSIYSHDGRLLKETPDLVTTTGAMAAMMTFEPARAAAIYRDQIAGGTNHTGAGYYWKWGYLSDLSTNEWGWFALALYNKALPDLWHSGGK